MRKPETKLMSAIFYTRYGRFFEDAELEESINGVSLREACISAINSLSLVGGPSFRSRIKRVLELRFGFADGRGCTLQEIGLEFGRGKERIRQIEAKGLRCLRHPTRSRILHHYIKVKQQYPDTVGKEVVA